MAFERGQAYMLVSLESPYIGLMIMLQLMDCMLTVYTTCRHVSLQSSAMCASC